MDRHTQTSRLVLLPQGRPPAQIAEEGQRWGIRRYRLGRLMAELSPSMLPEGAGEDALPTPPAAA